MKKTMLLFIIFLTSIPIVQSQSYELWGWGDNTWNQVRPGSVDGILIPVKIDNSVDWKKFSTNGSSNIAIKQDGSIWGWGYNHYGLFTGGGLGNWRQKLTQIEMITNVKEVSVDWLSVIAMKGDGSLWSWGNNDYGQLGYENNKDGYSPAQIGTETDWEVISAGNLRVFAIKQDGSLWAWGNNESGALGDSTNIHKNIPTRIGKDKDWKAISTGWLHTIALKKDGSLWGWGDNTFGQAGASRLGFLPSQVGKESDWKVISAGFEHTVAIKQDGSLWAWGSNGVGQCGDGSDTNRFIPVRIGTSTEWEKIAAGQHFTIAIKRDGSLWAWGHNGGGQLGDSTRTDKNIPTRIGNGSNWEEVFASVFTAFAFRKSATSVESENIVTSTIKSFTPNPVADELKLTIDADDFSITNNIEIYNLLGQKVFEMRNLSLNDGTNEVTLNLEYLNPGSYILRFNNAIQGIFIKVD